MKFSLKKQITVTRYTHICCDAPKKKTPKNNRKIKIIETKQTKKEEKYEF